MSEIDLTPNGGKKKGTPKKATAKKATRKAAPKKSATKKNNSKKVDVKTKKSIGLGDIMENVAKATGVKKAVELFTEATGLDCGCDERKERFNKINFKYGSRTKIHRCPTKSEFEKLQAILLRSKRVLTKKDAAEFAKIYSQIFGVKFEIWCPICTSIWKQKIREIKSVLAFYKDELKDLETTVNPEQS